MSSTSAHALVLTPCAQTTVRDHASTLAVYSSEQPRTGGVLTTGGGAAGCVARAGDSHILATHFRLISTCVSVADLAHSALAIFTAPLFGSFAEAYGLCQALTSHVADAASRRSAHSARVSRKFPRLSRTPLLSPLPVGPVTAGFTGAVSPVVGVAAIIGKQLTPVGLWGAHTLKVLGRGASL